MAQLYAVNWTGGQFEVKVVQLNTQVQAQIEIIFKEQEAAFVDGISEEIIFTGDWKPEDDELLLLRGLPACGQLLSAANQNALSLPVLNVGAFQAENVRGLYTSVGQGVQQRLLLQNFSPQQLLSGRFALLFDGNVFREITEPVFSLATNLVAIITAAGDIRFKNYSMLRRILDLAPSFRAATNPELQYFCAHESLAVSDAADFVANADEGIRKHVVAITKANVLGKYDVPTIEARAVAIGFPMQVANGRIALPQDRRGAKALLSFLLNKVYQGPLAQQLFITNSNRPFT